MKAIAPNTERPVPGSDSPSARRTRSISSTRRYSVSCCSSDSTSRGSSRRGPPASSCSAQATRYPEDVAYALLYLASAQARFVTGHDIVLDGGQILPERPLGV